MDENKRIFSKRPGLSTNIVVPILVVIFLTGLAVWMVPDDDAETDKKKPLPKLGSVIKPLDSNGPSVRPLDKEVNDSKDEKATSSGKIERAAPSIEGGARALIAKLRKDGASSSQRAFEEAEKRRNVGDIEDAYLLYFFAAKQGHGDAAMVLGTQSDPIHFTSVSSALDEPDPGQAIKWYKIAIDSGNKDARKNLAELSKHIRKQAEAGSSQAKRLMLQLR